MHVATSFVLQEYLRQTRDDGSVNKDVGKQRMAFHYDEIMGISGSNVVEQTRRGGIKADQPTYYLPPNYIGGGLKTLALYHDKQRYVLTPITSIDIFNRTCSPTATALHPTHALVMFEQGRSYIRLWPTPTQEIAYDFDAGNYLEIVYDGELPPLTFPDDYTTGTITATAGNAGVTGASTVWTSAMIGRFLKVVGGQHWYEIAGVSSNTGLTLLQPFQEASVAGKTYVIAELMRTAPQFANSPLYAAIAAYYRPTNDKKSEQYDGLYARDITLAQKMGQPKVRGSVIPGKPVSGQGTSARRIWRGF